MGIKPVDPLQMGDVLGGVDVWPPELTAGKIADQMRLAVQCQQLCGLDTCQNIR